MDTLSPTLMLAKEPFALMPWTSRLTSPVGVLIIIFPFFASTDDPSPIARFKTPPVGSMGPSPPGATGGRTCAWLTAVKAKMLTPAMMPVIVLVVFILNLLTLVRRFGCMARLYLSALVPIVRPALAFFFFVAVTFLHDAEKFVVVTFGFEQIVVGELTPFLFEFTLEFFPASFELIFVHGKISLVFKARKVPASAASTPPVIFLAVVLIELGLILPVEFVGIEFRAGFNRFAREVDVDVGTFPIHRRDPWRGHQDFLSRQPLAGIDDHVANGPGFVVDNKIFDVTELAVGRLNRIADNVLHAAQMRTIHLSGEGNLSVDILRDQILRHHGWTPDVVAGPVVR